MGAVLGQQTAAAVVTQARWCRHELDLDAIAHPVDWNSFLTCAWTVNLPGAAAYHTHRALQQPQQHCPEHPLPVYCPTMGPSQLIN